ncbi:hypothetical protein PG984_000078 [Apiospora sp. TS-2023a]
MLFLNLFWLYNSLKMPLRGPVKASQLRLHGHQLMSNDKDATTFWYPLEITSNGSTSKHLTPLSGQAT